MRNNPIGIFDSGIGGLTVTKEIIKILPSESIIYLGDTARVPYGPKSKEEVSEFALQLVKFLLGQAVKCLVIACNTISANSLDIIRKVSRVPVVEVIEPAVKKAILVTRKLRIGVIGTQGTIQSKAYNKAIAKLNPKIKVVSCACPLFVPLAEEGAGGKKVNLLAKEYLAEIIEEDIDTLILGCTHYPLLLAAIKEVVGDEVTLVDPAKPTAEELKNILEDNDLLSEKKDPIYEFLVTDAPDRVFDIAGHFFGSELRTKIRKVSL